MVKEAVEAGADIIMLDNMSIDEMKEAVAYINGRALTECSGNVTKETIKDLARNWSGLYFQRCFDTFSSNSGFIFKEFKSGVIMSKIIAWI